MGYWLWATDVRTKKKELDMMANIPDAHCTLLHVISAKRSIAQNVIGHKNAKRDGKDTIQCFSTEQ